MGSMASSDKISFTDKLPNQDDSYEILKKYIKEYSYSLTKSKFNKSKDSFINEKTLINEFKILKVNTDYNENRRKRLIGYNNKNRYGDIGPFKDNVVPLKNNNYINASFINIPNEHSFIATQGPLDTTISDFWEMIIDYNVMVIVMLCNTIEGNNNKCSEYWNKQLIEKDNLFVLKNITLIDSKFQNLIIREIEIQKNGNWEIKKVFHFQFIGWPDHDVPNEEYVFDTFLYLFEQINEKKSNTTVVHCSAGVGRTGTFLTLINLYNDIVNQIKNNCTEISFSIFGLVRQLKEMRYLLVENDKQYIFIYKFLKIMLEQIFKQNQ